MPRFPKTQAVSQLDGQPYTGQRSSTFRFDIVDSVTGYRRAIKPVIGGSAGIRHDTRSTIKRMITGLQLGVADTAAFNSVTSRLEPVMIIKGEEFPLGRYIPSDWVSILLSRGSQSITSFYDEGFIIDQQIPSAFGANSAGGTSGEVVNSMLQRFLKQYPIEFMVETTDFASFGAWSAGTRGGFVLEQMALDGDYLSPWFDHSSILQLKRTFDPADQIPTFDFDDNLSVLNGGIIVTNNLINAPNRFVVIGNGPDSFSDAIVGQADVPSSAPHSIANRGFVIADVSNRQIRSSAQAGAIAKALVQRQAIIEQTEFDTLPDPRHDAYDVIKWQGVNWLEISWTLSFTAGVPMKHILQRAYSDQL
jgi:hypothetical protein